MCVLAPAKPVVWDEIADKGGRRHIDSSDGRSMTQRQAASPSRDAWQHLIMRLLSAQTPLAWLARRLLVTLGVVAGLVSLGAALTKNDLLFSMQKDFIQSYVLARAVAEGIDPYQPITMLAARYLGPETPPTFPHPSPHPPTLALLLLPLALFDYRVATLLWLGLNLVVLELSLYPLADLAGKRLSVRKALIAGAIALAWFPVYLTLREGQVNLLLLLLVAGAVAALQHDRRLLAGVALGASLLIKQVMWPLLLLLLLRRQWRAVAACLVTVLIGYTLAAGVVGLPSLWTYLIDVLPAVARYYQGHVNQSVWNLGHRLALDVLIVGLPRLQPFQSLLATGLAAGLSALVLIGAVVTTLRLPLIWAAGVMVCVSIVINPISWPHYLVLALVPAASVFRWLWMSKGPVRETNWALVIALLLLPSYGVWSYLTPLSDQATDAFVTDNALLALMWTLLLKGPALAAAALAWLCIALGREDPAPLHRTNEQAHSTGTYDADEARRNEAFG